MEKAKITLMKEVACDDAAVEKETYYTFTEDLSQVEVYTDSPDVNGFVWGSAIFSNTKTYHGPDNEVSVPRNRKAWVSINEARIFTTHKVVSELGVDIIRTYLYELMEDHKKDLYEDEDLFEMASSYVSDILGVVKDHIVSASEMGECVEELKNQLDDVVSVLKEDA